jgi:hypothetical protein
MAKTSKELNAFISKNFDLKTYERANEMSIIDWYNALSFRKFLFQPLLPNVKDDEILNRVRESLHYASIYPQLEIGSTLSLPPEMHFTPIIDLKIKELNAELNKKSELEKFRTRLTLHRPVPIEEHFKPIFFERNYSITAESGKFSNERNLAITVDLKASDHDIVSGFRKWLAEKREAQKDINFRTKTFSEKEIEGWIRNGVLPYLDLKLLEKVFESDITNVMMGDLLFPHEFGAADTTERVRKVVQPLAKKVQGEVFLDALQYAAYNYAKNLEENSSE